MNIFTQTEIAAVVSDDLDGLIDVDVLSLSLVP